MANSLTSRIRRNFERLPEVGQTIWLGPVQRCPRYGLVRLRRIEAAGLEKTEMEIVGP